VVSGAFGHRLIEFDLDTQAFERALCIGGKAFIKARKYTSPSFDEDNACRASINIAKVRPQRASGQFCDSARKLYARRPRTYDDEDQKRGSPLRIAFEFRKLKG
jgi:hypothetical protein